MRNDKRKARRRVIHHTAAIALEGDRLLSCSLLDVSDTGARIEADGIDVIPDRFELLLTGNGKPRRECRVVWRQENSLGVTFENRPTFTERSA
ncbi:MAG: PilZ domain-containing protein [Pseudolabrys sp.]|jgi:methyl-accepting chemotaxis protein